MNRISVNGTTYELPDGATDVRISGGTLTVGGAPIASGLSGEVRVRWEGPLASLDCRHGSVTVEGDVAGDVDCGGSATCGNVGGSVDAGGSVSCGNVTGDVDAGGSVRCGSVGGRVDAGGSVRRG